MHPLPPPWLTDGQLVVRRYRRGDGPAVREAIVTSVEHLRPWMPWAADEPQPVQAKEELIAHWVEQWDAGNEFVYAITPAGDEAMIIGGTGLHPRLVPSGFEIGYWVRADHVRRGVASGAARLLTDAALQLEGIERVEIHHDEANVASAAVPCRLGFRRVSRRAREALAPAESGVEWVWRMDADAWDPIEPSCAEPSGPRL